jgi:hypothetical protein
MLILTLVVSCGGPSTAEIQLTGVVERVESTGFTLRDVQVQSGPQPCTLSGLRVESSRTEPRLNVGDSVQVQGAYDSSSCVIKLEKSTHTMKVTVAAPVAIKLEGVIERVSRGSLVLRDVSVLDGPSPCTLSALPVEIQRDVLAPEGLAAQDHIAVTGEYQTDNCTVMVKNPPHVVSFLPVPIELEGIVRQGQARRFTLQHVAILSGPTPCSLQSLTVTVDPARASLPELQEALKVRVFGEYHTADCEVYVGARTHRIEALPTPVRLEGRVLAVDTQGVTLGGVKVLDGPTPCRTDSLKVIATLARPPRPQEALQVQGQYDPVSCEVVALQVLPTTSSGTPATGLPSSDSSASSLWSTLPFVASGGISLIGDIQLIGGALGFQIMDRLYVQAGASFGSGETRNPHGVPIEVKLQAYSVEVLYQITDLFLVGGGGGLLSFESAIGSRWSQRGSVPFLTVVAGIKFGPLFFRGGAALPLGD